METSEAKLDRVVVEAFGEFWNVVAREYPECRTGDLAPEFEFPLVIAATRAVRAWIDGNGLSLYTLDGEPLGQSLERWMAENDFDHAVCTEIVFLKVGEEKLFGGGAAPVRILKRIK